MLNKHQISGGGAYLDCYPMMLLDYPVSMVPVVVGNGRPIFDSQMRNRNSSNSIILVIS